MTAKTLTIPASVLIAVFGFTVAAHAEDTNEPATGRALTGTLAPAEAEETEKPTSEPEWHPIEGDNLVMCRQSSDRECEGGRPLPNCADHFRCPPPEGDKANKSKETKVEQSCSASRCERVERDADGTVIDRQVTTYPSDMVEEGF